MVGMLTAEDVDEFQTSAAWSVLGAIATAVADDSRLKAQFEKAWLAEWLGCALSIIQIMCCYNRCSGNGGGVCVCALARKCEKHQWSETVSMKF
eukprot:4714220-Amphidinium_carterae.2